MSEVSLSVVTDEMRSFIGVNSEPVTYEISHREIARFNAAISGVLPPVEDDPDLGSNGTGLKALPTIVRSLLSGPFDPPFPEPFHDILDGGSSYTFFRDVVPGDRITVVRSLTDVYERSGRLGPMLFKITEVRYTDQADELVASQSSTTITYGRPFGSVRGDGG